MSEKPSCPMCMSPQTNAIKRDYQQMAHEINSPRSARADLPIVYRLESYIRAYQSHVQYHHSMMEDNQIQLNKMLDYINYLKSQLVDKGIRYHSYEDFID